MLFYKEYNFTTANNKEEIRKILKGMKEPSDKKVWIFDGDIHANEFSISPIFYSGHERRFRPVLHGTIVSDLSECKIHLELTIPVSLKILLYFAIIFNGSIWLYFFFLNIHIELIIALPICLLIGFIMLLVDFYQNGNRAVKILISKLRLKTAKQFSRY